jgi:hypothetical protein
LTPALTWGAFGLVLGSAGLASAVIWSMIGAVCGGLYSYYAVRHATKTELARIGGRLPAQSSAWGGQRPGTPAGCLRQPRAISLRRQRGCHQCRSGKQGFGQFARCG